MKTTDQSAMPSAAVRYAREGPVAWLTLNRPEARNALNAAARDGLRDGFERFEADAEARVLAVTGAGDRAFCAGGDLKEIADRRLGPPPPNFMPYLNQTVTVTKPVIAAVNGDALGGGFLLAQMCDLCVTADTARFGITEARWGRGAPWAAPLAWLIPPRVAMELLLTARPIDAHRAYEVGLVNRVVPGAELQRTVQGIGELIAANAPLSVKAGKALVYAAAEAGWTEALVAGYRLFDPVYRSDDAQEGPRAFTERRQPRWTGT